MGDLVLNSVAEAAAALDHAQAQIRAGEVTSLVAILALCDLHRVDDTVLVAGAERWVQGGADGTPHIGEFVAGEVAGLLGVSVGSAFERIADTLNLRFRHPILWQHILAGDIRVWDATRVARAAVAAGLDLHACWRLDEMCATALAHQPWQRVRKNIHRWILLADPTQATERAAAKSRSRHVSLGAIEDGQVNLWAQLDAADGLALDEALNQIADTLTHPNDDDDRDGVPVDRQERRATALGLMARHVLGHEPLPTANQTTGGASKRKGDIIVHLDGNTLADPTTGVATLDRWGHVLLPHLENLLAGHQIRVRPVIAGADLPPVDAYEVPEAMWLAVQARNRFDVFPYGSREARSCQADHTRRFDHHNKTGTGQTRPGNLGPLSGFTHRLKTHGGWQLTQPAPGYFLWRSPLGYEYAVTPHGTTMINRPPPRQREWWHQEPPDEPPAWATQEAHNWPPEDRHHPAA